MNEHIYKIPVGGNYVKYEVNILTLLEPEIFDNRNKLIHGTSRTMERVS